MKQRTNDKQIASSHEVTAKPTVTVARVGDQVTINVHAPAAPVLPPDDLVSYPFGLEARAARGLVRSGQLKAARLGRRLYCKRSDLVGLIDTLSARSGEPVDEYQALVAKSRRGHER